MSTKADRSGLKLQTRTHRNAGQAPQFTVEQLEHRSLLSDNPITPTIPASVPVEAGAVVATQSFFVREPDGNPQG